MVARGVVPVGPSRGWRVRRRWSATTTPTTGTPDKGTRTATHAEMASNKPTRNDAPAIETNR